MEHELLSGHAAAAFILSAAALHRGQFPAQQERIR